jgi:cellulose synthase/poly-beta-1,6-N-acetylglucosamine synthase-like glycosyltransferase
MQWLILILIIPYLYLLLKIYSGLARIKPFHAAEKSEIFVSVIVACRNEEKKLPSLLSDIAGQNYSRDMFELIIVDDNSSDSTFETTSGFSAIKNFKVLKNTGSGKKKAVKTGVEAADGTLIITTDADCRTGKNWLATIVSFFDKNKPEMIICQVKPESGRGFFRRFQELEFLSLQGITAGTAALFNPVMCNGANLAFLKETYLRHADSLHDELASGDDIFLLHSIKKDPGNRILWLESGEAMVTTKNPDTLISFLRQRARWISKAGSYNDLFTKVLAIVTFVTVSVQLLILTCGLLNPGLLWVFTAFFVLKSIPDFLILNNTAVRYNERALLKWFVPSQLVYPVYVLAAVLYSLRRKTRIRF